MLYSSDSVKIVILSVIFPILAALAVACRFKSRKIKTLPLQADDKIIVLALVCAQVEKNLLFLLTKIVDRSWHGSTMYPWIGGWWHRSASPRAKAS